MCYPSVLCDDVISRGPCQAGGYAGRHISHPPPNAQDEYKEVNHLKDAIRKCTFSKVFQSHSLFKSCCAGLFVLAVRHIVSRAYLLQQP